MVEEFEVSAERGIPIVVVAGARLVLDTGSPVSIARTGSIALGGREHRVAVECTDENPNRLSEHLGKPVHGLLGCDLLEGRILDLNCPAGRAYVITEDTNLEIPFWLANAITLPVDRSTGVPIAQVSVNRHQVSAAIDMGVSACIALPHLLEGRHPIGRNDSSYLGIGCLTTDLHVASIQLGNEDRSVCLPVASAPTSLAPLLARFGLEAILGGEVLMGAEILFDFRSEPGFVLLSSHELVRRAPECRLP